MIVGKTKLFLLFIATTVSMLGIVQQQSVAAESLDALSSMQFTVNCPSVPDLTMATQSVVDSIKKDVRKAIASTCGNVYNHQFLSSLVLDTNILAYQFGSTYDSLRVNRCVDRKIKSNNPITTNDCTITASDPIYACVTSFDATVTVNVNMNQNLLSKNPGKLVKPMRSLGQNLAATCGLSECDIEIWLIDSLNIISSNSFEMNVKDQTVADTLESCLQSNTVSVANWFTVSTIIAPTTTQSPTTTIACIGGFRTSQSTDWVKSCDRRSCDHTCANFGKTCNPTPIVAIDTAAEIQFVANLLSFSCNSFVLRTTSIPPYYKSPPIAAGNVCYYGTPDMTTACSFQPNNYYDSPYVQNLCCCGSNCPLTA